MISPTGKGIRVADKFGLGRYGAPRGPHRHRGADYVCEPGQDIISPIAGVFVREANPYALPSKYNYRGLLIESPFMTLEIFYVYPIAELLGHSVKQGQVIGTAQDISRKYPGITPHVHLQIISIDPEIFTKML